MSQSAKARLLAKVAWVGDCLIWNGGMGSGGYGTFHYQGKNRSAHRVSFVLHKGEIPDGMVVMHTCDHRRCINPEHLILGTSKDNSADMLKKGRDRQPSGAEHHNTKLNPAAAAEIRQRYKPYDRQHGSSALAREFGVTQATVHALLSGATWKINSLEGNS